MATRGSGNDVCNTCSEDTPPGINLKHCSKCRGGATYCNADCQKRDWPIHKIFCNVVAREDIPEKEGTVQALLLPQDDTTPLLVRAKVGSNSPIVGVHVDAAEFISGTLGVDIKAYCTEQFPQYQTKPANEMDCAFSLYYGNQSANVPKNECMKRILAGYAKVFYGSGMAAKIAGGDFWKTFLRGLKKWRGLILIAKCDRYETNGLPAPTYEDFDIGDVPNLVIFLSFLSKIVAAG